MTNYRSSSGYAGLPIANRQGRPFYRISVFSHGDLNPFVR